MSTTKTRTKTTFRVTVERDEDGWWVATVHGVAGVHTQGRTIAEARRFARDALAAAIGREAADAAELEMEPALPKNIQELVDRHRAARAQAEKLQGEAQGLATTMVRQAKKLGLSVRDVGELLGLSHQRVQQLAKARG